jgi:hypothetical protein
LGQAMDFRWGTQDLPVASAVLHRTLGIHLCPIWVVHKGWVS